MALWALAVVVAGAALEVVRHTQIVQPTAVPEEEEEEEVTEDREAKERRAAEEASAFIYGIPQ